MNNYYQLHSVVAMYSRVLHNRKINITDYDALMHKLEAIHTKVQTSPVLAGIENAICVQDYFSRVKFHLWWDKIDKVEKDSIAWYCENFGENSLVFLYVKNKGTEDEVICVGLEMYKSYQEFLKQTGMTDIGIDQFCLSLAMSWKHSLKEALAWSIKNGARVPSFDDRAFKSLGKLYRLRPYIDCTIGGITNYDYAKEVQLG